MEICPVNGATFRFIETNGIRMRIAEIGEGPLVVLAHGWPESWFSWRHQMTALAEAGYRVAVPDMRGYGETDKPEDVDAYDILRLARDMVGIVDALGESVAHLVGHDWGSMVAANTALLHPERFASVTLMSVPFNARPSDRPTEILRSLFADNFFYILYHNEPGGVAEAEYDADPASFLRRLYVSPDADRHDPAITDPARSAGGWIPRLGEPVSPPQWISAAELDYIVGMFERSGFRGGLNYYRNFDRNWELMAPHAEARIEIPTMFVAGSADGVILGADETSLRAGMSGTVADLREVVLIPGIGHWLQQEAPEATSRALIDFFASLG